MIEHLSSLRLIKAGGRQRIDSTHIIGCVRELSRIELLHENLRLFCLDVEVFKSQMDLTLLTIHEKYVDNVSTYKMTEGEKKLALRLAGLTMKVFLAWTQSEQVVSDLRAMQSLKTMRTVFVQNFIDNVMEPELIKVVTVKGRICKPEPRCKIYILRPENETLSQRRKQLEDPEYRKDLNHRNGVEGTISGLMRRQKIRRC